LKWADDDDDDDDDDDVGFTTFVAVVTVAGGKLEAAFLRLREGKGGLKRGRPRLGLGLLRLLGLN